MYLLALYFIFINAGVNGLGGRALGVRGGNVLTAICLSAAFGISALQMVEVCGQGCSVSVMLSPYFFRAQTFAPALAFCWDPLAAGMSLTVVWVSFAVHLYQSAYMAGDSSQNLFVAYLSAFTGFMLVLVAADNLVVLFIGWEGIGVCSYLLIGYYASRLAATKSANKSLIVNKVSDGFLLCSLLYLWHYTGGLAYSDVTLFDVPAVVGLCVLLGAIGKSSQLGFHVWLADAMEGPTPVSALIHAATLVTAGVYLLCKLNLHCNAYVAALGAITALAGGLFGMVANDLKRVIAFSTCSQLGYMIAAIGSCSDGMDFAMAHLMSHAGFKATLFLAAGLLISKEHNNSLNRFGARQPSKVLTFATAIASFNLAGFPELGGFYSKESILNTAFAHQGLHVLLLAATFLTAAYSTKVLFQLYAMEYSNGRAAKDFALNAAVLSCFALLLAEMLVRVYTGSSFAQNFSTHLPAGVKNLPFGIAIAGALSGSCQIALLPWVALRFLGNRAGFDLLYARQCTPALYYSSYISYALFDRGYLKLY
uniref:NADH-ubiquinone oxidoreductase chain 5 n=1 Tax=Polytomella capuana TaxID=351368 RepID=B0YN34_9CHLO|nr:NADH dehydrogenase subunit 5 [Polytomella capuana]ABV56566.1 NADH dehydrogenase subunit 5 [Polytomella capuana]